MKNLFFLLLETFTTFKKNITHFNSNILFLKIIEKIIVVEFCGSVRKKTDENFYIRDGLENILPILISYLLNVG